MVLPQPPFWFTTAIDRIGKPPGEEAGALQVLTRLGKTRSDTNRSEKRNQLLVGYLEGQATTYRAWAWRQGHSLKSLRPWPGIAQPHRQGRQPQPLTGALNTPRPGPGQPLPGKTGKIIARARQQFGTVTRTPGAAGSSSLNRTCRVSEDHMFGTEPVLFGCAAPAASSFPIGISQQCDSLAL